MNAPDAIPALAGTEHRNARVCNITRPHPALWTYYAIVSCAMLIIPPAGIINLILLRFRYRTMQYRFDDDGVTMRWGILFRREVILNYARIQDIHLVSNFIERWLGLARIQIQTASGSATPEMTIEGVKEFEEVRDFIYSKMRGTREVPRVDGKAGSTGMNHVAKEGTGSGDAELARILGEVATEIRHLRADLEKWRPK